jgi:uncharacterized membrane protein YtjA (UPF0391 family)
LLPVSSRNKARTRRGGGRRGNEKENAMGLLKWALIFAVIAIIAAIFGFGGVAEGAADIAQLLFYIFLGIVVVLVILGLITFRSVT